MKLENQVCSLELSKRLKELGVKQDSLWWWHGRMMADEMHYTITSCDVREECREECGFLASAFTCAELMKIHYELNYGNYPDFSGLGINPNGLANFIAKEIVGRLKLKE